MRIAQSQISMTSSRQFIKAGTRENQTSKKDFIDSAKDTAKTTELNRGVKAAPYQNDILNLLIQRLMSRLSGGSSGRLTTYSEYESTEFHARGSALTEDGRSIDFSVDIVMTRSYMEYTDVNIPFMQNALCDPLMINVGPGISSIRDQKFIFDLDADGTGDSIPMPGRNSGFLALDKNNDGIINDGNELFGTKSGDGFADLKEYDSDGNGWIDENDDIFQKLRVWCKGDNGEDILMDLKEADIGAIYLGCAATEFSLTGMNGLRDGVIRSTGLFLKESIGVGTVQHVDLAMGGEDEYRPESIIIDRLFDEGYTLPEKHEAPAATYAKKITSENKDDSGIEESRESSRSRERELEERVKRKKASEKLLKETRERHRKNKLLEKEQFEKKLYQERAREKAWQHRKAMRAYLYSDSPQYLSDTVSYA